MALFITEIIIIGSSSEDPRSVSCSNRTFRSLNFRGSISRNRDVEAWH